MATKSFKIELKNSDIPFLPRLASSPVVISNLDKAGRMPRSFYGAEEGVDYNTTQIIYAENMLPATFGFTAAQVLETVSVGIQGSLVGLSDVFAYYSNRRFSSSMLVGAGGYLSSVTVDTSGLLSVTNLGSLIGNGLGAAGIPYNFAGNYTVYGPNLWHVTYADAELVAAPSYWAKYMSYAYFNGVILACVGSGYYNGSTGVSISLRNSANTFFSESFLAGLWSSVPDTGLYGRTVKIDTNGTSYASFSPSVTGVETDGLSGAPTCVAASNGYMLLGMGRYFRWGVPNGDKVIIFNSTDTSGNATGAGYQIPNDLQGSILWMSAVEGGVLLFSDSGCVAAVYSGDAEQPWIYRKLDGAGGFVSGWNMTSVTPGKGIYALTSKGLQYITINSAKSVLPAVTDWLALKTYPAFDSITRKVVETTLGASFIVRLAYCGSHTLVISYGTKSTTTTQTFTGAFIYDERFSRWGHLKLDHTGVFSAPKEATGYNRPQICEAWFFLPNQNVGIIVQGDSGVLVTSDISLTRDRFTELHSVTAHFGQDVSAILPTPACSVLPSYEVSSFVATATTFVPDNVNNIAAGNYSSVKYRGIIEGRTLQLALTLPSIVDVILEAAPGSKE